MLRIIMAPTVLKERSAPRRSIFSILALFSVIVLGLLAVSVLNSDQNPRSFKPTLQELDDVDFDNHEEVKQFLASKVRASAGDQYL